MTSTTHFDRVFQAECLEIWNSRSGYYATPEEAISAVMTAAWFSRERAQSATLLVRGYGDRDPDVLEYGRRLLAAGRPSPALGLTEVPQLIDRATFPFREEVSV